MRILIIGSKGFIGSGCISYLQTHHEVCGCDVLPADGSTNYFQLNSINTDFSPLFEKKNFDACINCSGAASVPDSIINPAKDFDLNTNNVFKILDGIAKYQPGCKFLNLSSAAVYGNPVSLPVNEKAAILPLSPYGWHKHYAELICKEFTVTKNISTCSVRIFSAYGEGLKKQLFWDLYQKGKSRKTVELFGTGNESRDFIYIRDLARLLEMVVEKADFKGECINAAGGQEIFLKEAVELFYSLVDPVPSYKFTDQVRKGDPLNWCADTSTIQSMGYMTQYTLQQGLQNYVQWLKEEKL
jgi:dTDP-glucose 4,6-dehydratase/UDP-glucose 4-epimerase